MVFWPTNNRQNNKQPFSYIHEVKIREILNRFAWRNVIILFGKNFQQKICCCRIYIGADCSRVVKTGYTNPNHLTEVLNGQVMEKLSLRLPNMEIITLVLIRRPPLKEWALTKRMFCKGSASFWMARSVIVIILISIIMIILMITASQNAIQADDYNAHLVGDFVWSIWGIGAGRSYLYRGKMADIFLKIKFCNMSGVVFWSFWDIRTGGFWWNTDWSVLVFCIKVIHDSLLFF